MILGVEWQSDNGGNVTLDGEIMTTGIRNAGTRDRKSRKVDE
jgi:hypothetical protein